MNQHAQLVAFVAVGFVAWAISLSVYGRRHTIAQHLRHRSLMFGSYLLVLIVVSKYTDPLNAVLIAIIAGVFVGNRTYPRRSRYIPKRERRRAIARFELSGERYNSRKHEIDHVIPHSRGGVNTADNLRVIARERNRAKSAKSPWWDLLGKN
jgi:hypothetical protein